MKILKHRHYMISEEIAENEKIEVDTSRQRKRHKYRRRNFFSALIVSTI